MDIKLDDQNRLVSAEGKVCLTVIDTAGTRNKLEIEFTVSAGDYGTSVVGAFDPAEYGVISWEEFFADDSEEVLHDVPEEPGETPAPETLIFNGVEYTLDLNEIGEDNG